MAGKENFVFRRVLVIEHSLVCGLVCGECWLKAICDFARPIGSIKDVRRICGQQDFCEVLKSPGTSV